MFCPVPSTPPSTLGITLTVGSGLYRVAGVVPAGSATLVRNPYYHGRARALRPDHVRLRRHPESLEADVAADRLDYSLTACRRSLITVHTAKYRSAAAPFYKPLRAVLPALTLKSPLFENNVPLRRAVRRGRPSRDRRQTCAVRRAASARCVPRVSRDGGGGIRCRARLELARRLAKSPPRGNYTFTPSPARPTSGCEHHRLQPARQIGLHVTSRQFGALVEQPKLLQPTSAGTSAPGVAGQTSPPLRLRAADRRPPEACRDPDPDSRRANGVRARERPARTPRSPVSPTIRGTRIRRRRAAFPSRRSPSFSPGSSCVSIDTMSPELNLSNVCLRG